MVTWRRRFLGGPKFERMRVVSWHLQTLPHHIPSILEAPIPNQDLIGYLHGTRTSIMLRLNFNKVAIDFHHASTITDMTHVVVLNAKVRRNDWFK